MKAFRVAHDVLRPAMVILLLASCQDQTLAPNAGGQGFGRIHGRVRTGGNVEATISVRRQSENPWDDWEIASQVDQSGAYSVDVPTGRYYIYLRFANGGPTLRYQEEQTSFASPDLLVVDAVRPLVRADFNLATLRVRLRVPEFFKDSTSIRLSLYEIASDERRFWLSSPILRRVKDDFLGEVHVWPGRFKILASASWRPLDTGLPHQEDFWLPSVRDEFQAETYELLADHIQIASIRLPTSPAKIEGRVTGAWLAFGMSPPEIRLYTRDGRTVLNGYSVRPDGSFDYTVLVPGHVTVAVNQDGTRHWIGGTQAEDASVFHLRPGQTVSNIHFEQAGIHLRFEQPFDGLYDHRYRLLDATNLEPIWNRFRSGPVIGMANLTPGTYLLQIIPPFGSTPFSPQWYDRAPNSQQARLIHLVQPGQIVSLPLRLLRGGSISGLVRNAVDAIDDYQLTLVDAENPELYLGSLYVSNATASYALTGLANGDYKVGARTFGISASTNAIVWHPGTTDWSSAQTVSIHDYEHVQEINIEYPDPTP